MLYINPDLSEQVLEALIAAELEGLDRALSIVENIISKDQLTAFITFLLLGYRHGRQMKVVSPWIEDLALYLPSSIAMHIDGVSILRFSDIIRAIALRGKVLLVTRTSRRDLLEDTSIGRRELLSLLPDMETIEVVYLDTVHTKCIEVDSVSIISTANFTHKELYKLRTYENRLTLSKIPCMP